MRNTTRRRCTSGSLSQIPRGEAEWYLREADTSGSKPSGISLISSTVITRFVEWYIDIILREILAMLLHFIWMVENVIPSDEFMDMFKISSVRPNPTLAEPYRTISSAVPYREPNRTVPYGPPLLRSFGRTIPYCSAEPYGTVWPNRAPLVKAKPSPRN